MKLRMEIRTLLSIFLSKINHGNPMITYSFSKWKGLVHNFHRIFRKVLCCIRIDMTMIVEITKTIVNTINLFFKIRKKRS